MQRDRGYLLDILDAARLALSYVDKVTKEEFLHDVQRQDAVIRRFEIIGEAAGRVSKDLRIVLPNLPWAEMVGIRNLLIHEYGDIDLDIVWDTLQIDLPPLIDDIEHYLSS